MRANSLTPSAVDRRGNNRFRRLAWMVPYILAILIMLPRIASANFGLLDDAVTFQTVDGTHQTGLDLWDLQSGRSRPLYWLYWLVVRVIAGSHAEFYFVINTLLLLSTLWLVQRLIDRLGGKQVHFLITGFVFLLSTPTIENYYTLSKAEPLQMLLILLAFVLLARTIQSAPQLRQAIFTVVVATVILAAALVKETTAVLLPFAAILLLLGYLFRVDPSVRRFLLLFLAASALGVAAFLAIRFLLVGVNTAEGYASGYEFTVQRIASSVSRWGAWMLYGFSYFLVLLPVLLTRSFRRAPSVIMLIITALLAWIGVWIVSYLPWIFVASYYLLPVALGIGFTTSVIVEYQFSAEPIRSRILPTALLGLSGVLFLVMQLNTYTFARQQLLVDRVNWEMLTWVDENLPENSKLLTVLPAGNEYTLEISLHLLKSFHREDLNVLSIEDLPAGDPMTTGEDAYLLLPTLDHQVLLSPRMGIDEVTSSMLEERYLEMQTAKLRILHTLKGYFDIRSINPPSIFCLVLDLAKRNRISSQILPLESITRYCASTPLLETNTFEYGWSVLQEGP
jgi:hypothetical protein